MWQLDNYLAVLLLAGFILYIFVMLIGIVVDQFIDYYFAAKKYITSKLKGKKING
jgi:hypothetical protein